MRVHGRGKPSGRSTSTSTSRGESRRSRCSTIGPSASAGTNVRAPTSTHHADQQRRRTAACGSAACRRRRDGLLARPASRRWPASGSPASSGRRASRGRAPCCRRACWPPSPAKALPLLLPADENAYSTSLKPWAPGFEDRRPCPPGDTHADRRADQHDRRRDQDDQRGHLHLEGLDLLAQVLRRAADHQPGDEDGDDGEDQHAVEAGADAAEDHLAELHQPHRHEPAERRVGVVHRVDRAVEAAVVAVAHSAELAMPKRTSLPSMLPPAGARWPCGRRPASTQRCGRSARPVTQTTSSGDEDHRHGRQHRPALARVADHVAERVAERGRDQQDRQQLQEVRQRRRVLERMGRVDVEEAAAVGAELLDGDLRGGRAHGSICSVSSTAWSRLPLSSSTGLPSSSVRARRTRRLHTVPWRRREGLHDALRDQHERQDERQRQQDVERGPRQVDPEVADRRRRAPGEARIRATSTAMPAAAETKFCTVRPSIWVR